MLKRIISFIMLSVSSCLCMAQTFSGQYISEGQWNMNNKANWLNQLRLNLQLPIAHGKGAFEAATLHLAKTNEAIAADWQTFSNIEADNMLAAIAVLGYMQGWTWGHTFVGVRNVNEDFFTSDITALFTNSSCGIFPTIAASYPIANYPFSGLTLYFDVTRGGWTFKNSIYNGMGYNGWKHNDNPFRLNPKQDGIFNISQLEYAYHDAHYFAGLALHTRQYQVDDEGGLAPASEAQKHTTCAWWLYAEQPVWTQGKKSIACMAQYSENTCQENACYRYAELGCAYTDNDDKIALSGQYARFQQGTEYSAELTWRRQLNSVIALQPSFQYIKNDDGHYTMLTLRLCCNF